MTTADRDLRACRFCCLIKSAEDFFGTGCDNCKFYTSREAISSCTTPKFNG